MIVRAIVAMVVVVACGWSAAYAQGQGLAVAGPTDPTHGFPHFYQDKTGRSLEPCLDSETPGDPCGIADIAEPIAFPTKRPVPDRFFYWMATARIRGLGGNTSNRADLMMGLEGAFARPGADADGKQIVFARWRFRVPRGLLANATYTVTHPFGVNAITADATGAIDFTDDQGCATVPPACDFAVVLTATNIGPFLTWDSSDTAPPAGYIGDANIEHAVTGSPFHTNLFRIDGPNVAGPNRNTIETNLFAIIGKSSPPSSPLR